MSAAAKLRPVYRVYEKSGGKFNVSRNSRDLVYQSGRIKLIGIYYNLEIARTVASANANRYIQFPI